MQRRYFIERLLTQIYGGKPTDDAEITYNLVNAWLPDAIATAAKNNYVESIKIDGISYLNNSFYTTFSDIHITKDDTLELGYKFSLPEIPVGLGKNEGVSQVRFKDAGGSISLSAIPMSQSQAAYIDRISKLPPNKVLYVQEGGVIRMKSSLQLDFYTAVVRMASGGDSTNLDSDINVPPDYLPAITEYIKAQLVFERMQVPDISNDGADIK